MKAWTDARLEEGTKRTIAENAQMRGELAYQSEHTNKMSVMDEQRGKSATKARDATRLSLTPVPVRPRSRGERRFLRTFAVYVPARPSRLRGVSLLLNHPTP